MRTLSTLILFTCFVQVCFSQNNLIFESRELNFGNIIEGDTINVAFTFLNTFKHPINLCIIEPEKGCSFFGSTDTNIAPDSLGEIGIKFDSHNFYGSIVRNIKVTFCPDSQIVDLVIVGNVLRNNYHFKQYYPYLSGNILYMSKICYFGIISPTENLKCKIQVANSGDKTVCIHNFKGPSYLRFPKKVSIKAGEEKEIEVLMRYKKVPNEKLIRDLFSIETSEKKRIELNVEIYR